ncbi:MAG: phosphoribosylformylglycinamidine synthase I [Halobacteriota archaeon]
MTVAVVRFGGSNCDRDARQALEHLGFDAEIVWHEDGLPADATGVVLPGGFSYGDYLRAGAMAANTPIMDEIAEAAAGGTPVLGICNGAQICAEAGLAPGAFTVNESARFQCEHVQVRVETTASPWTAHLEVGEVLTLPIAHAEGRFEADDGTMARLEAEDRVLFRYCDADGHVTDGANPNGSRDNVAGVIGDRPHVAVLMPHPERATLPDLGLTDGQGVLRGASG